MRQTPETLVGRNHIARGLRTRPVDGRRQVYGDGLLQPRIWEDAATWQKRSGTEVVAERMVPLDSRTDRADSPGRAVAGPEAVAPPA